MPETPVEYGLARMVLGSGAFLRITEDQFDKLLAFRDIIVNSIYIEEKFDLLIENAKELEIEIINIATSSYLFHGKEHKDFHIEGNTLNRRMANLLTSCRLYIDHIDHHLSDLHKITQIDIDSVGKFKAEQYDQHFGYRFMEALRNHVQHRGLPINYTSYHDEKKKVDNETKFFVSLSLYMNTDEIVSNKKVKKSIREEVVEYGKKIDIMPLAREYVDCIWKIHEHVRSTLSSAETEAKSAIRSHMDSFRLAFPDEQSLIGLASVSKYADGTFKESVNLFEDFLEYNTHFRNKHRFRKRLTDTIVSNMRIWK